MITGSYNDLPARWNISHCLSCPKGTHSERSSMLRGCVPKAGHTSAETGIVAARCALGTFKANNGTGPCEFCPAGTFGPSHGLIACDLCPSFSHSLEGSSWKTGCICIEGYTGEDGGPCVACPLGTFKSENGSKHCEPCSSGKFSTVVGANSVEVCQMCPTNSTKFQCNYAKLPLVSASPPFCELDGNELVPTRPPNLNVTSFAVFNVTLGQVTFTISSESFSTQSPATVSFDSSLPPVGIEMISSTVCSLTVFFIQTTLERKTANCPHCDDMITAQQTGIATCPPFTRAIPTLFPILVSSDGQARYR